MHRGTLSIVASTLIMFSGRADPVSAQTSGTPQPEAKPYLYLWAAPAPPGSWGNISDRASQIVRVYASQTPHDAALEAINKQWAQTIGPSPATNPDHVCILLQNFGMYAPATNSHSSFHHELDKTTPVPDWFPGETIIPEHFYLQPWNEHGRAHAKAWMEAFLNEYESMRAPLDLEVPVRFHFDTESYFSACCEVNQIRILQAAFQDPRWGSSVSDPGLPVPGSADYLVPSGGVDKQMWQLYDEAKTAFGWPNLPLWHVSGLPANEALSRNNSATHPFNRRYMLWYWEITQRAIDAAMNECAYEPIKAKYPPTQYPNLKVSNYDHMDTDGLQDTFGWHTGRGNDGYIFGQFPSTYPTLQPMRTAVRAANNQGDAGASFFWSDFIDDNNGTPGVPQDDYRPSFFLATPGVASGDFSSPFLYPPNPPHWIGIWEGTDWGDRYHYYLPKVSGIWPKATTAQITLDYARRSVESIINTPDGTPSQVVPWIRPMGQEAKWGEAPNQEIYVTSSADFRDILAMLRAKKISEIIVWWGDGGNPPNFVPDWSTMKAIMDHVYKPQLNQIRVLTGTCTNCPTPPATAHVDRLRYTLREPTDANLEYIQVASSNVDPPQVAVRLTFGGMDGWVGNVTLNFEGSVNIDGLGSIEEMRGQVYVWDGHTWQLVPIDDYPGSPDSGFGFFAPINPAGDPSVGWYETRRTWENIPKYVFNGKMDIKIVLQRTTSMHPFTSRFDLVQLVGQQDTNQPAEGQEQGADFNHSQTTESYDVAAFMAAYAAGAESADFNNDGVVNGDDLTAFNAAFVAGPP